MLVLFRTDCHLDTWFAYEIALLQFQVKLTRDITATMRVFINSITYILRAEKIRIFLAQIIF